MSHVFPVGAKVLVDGRYKAVVRQSFPEGSTSFFHPHYRVDMVGGDKQVAVAMSRVGVVQAKATNHSTNVLRKVKTNRSSSGEMTVRQRMAEREKARKFFKSLDRRSRHELGDGLVLGDFDWRDWFDKRPSGTFMNALDEERINWEIMSS